MNDLLFQIVSVLVSGMGVSVGLTDIIRRLIQKGKQSEPDISEKIEKVSTVLSQSSGELANLQKELEGKLEFVNKLNEEANQAQNLLSLSHDQIEAIKTMLNQETQKENKINFWKSVFVNCRFPLRLTLRQSAGGGLACFRQYSDCGGVSCPLWFCFLLRTEMENAKRSLGFLHHYYGSPIPFFQMAAVFFSSLLRYARPFWANFPVTFYNNRNVRSAKNGRKKNATDFQKICGVAAWSIFNFHFHNVRGATAL